MAGAPELSALLSALEKSGAWPYLPIAQKARKGEIKGDHAAQLAAVRREAWAFEDRLGHPLRQLPGVTQP